MRLLCLSSEGHFVWWLFHIQGEKISHGRRSAGSSDMVKLATRWRFYSVGGPDFLVRLLYVIFCHFNISFFFGLLKYEVHANECLVKKSRVRQKSKVTSRQGSSPSSLRAKGGRTFIHRFTYLLHPVYAAASSAMNNATVSLGQGLIWLDEMHFMTLFSLSSPRLAVGDQRRVSSEVMVRLRLVTVVWSLVVDLFLFLALTFMTEFKQCGQHNFSSKCHLSSCGLEENSNIIHTDNWPHGSVWSAPLFSFRAFLQPTAWHKRTGCFIALKFHNISASPATGGHWMIRAVSKCLHLCGALCVFARAHLPALTLPLWPLMILFLAWNDSSQPLMKGLR